LDESPIFEKERRLAMAWVEGGIDVRYTLNYNIFLE
jgi:hypothetical protein